MTRRIERNELESLVRYSRPCMFCGRNAYVLLPPAASELDVDAEFSGSGRAFSDVEDGDMIGVGCYSCSEARR